jgi:hypothetical protein
MRGDAQGVRAAIPEDIDDIRALPADTNHYEKSIALGPPHVKHLALREVTVDLTGLAMV